MVPCITVVVTIINTNNTGFNDTVKAFITNLLEARLEHGKESEKRYSDISLPDYERYRPAFKDEYEVSTSG
jgi:hypothetical protein